MSLVHMLFIDWEVRDNLCPSPWTIDIDKADNTHFPNAGRPRLVIIVHFFYFVNSFCVEFEADFKLGSL